MEPNLQELKEEAMQIKDNRVSNCRVKLFTATGTQNVDGKQLLENQMNEFLSTIDGWYITNVTINVCKNFLPMTTMGEYQEMWYGMVCWSEDV